MASMSLQILQVGDQGVRAEPLKVFQLRADAEGEVDQVPEEHAGEMTAADAVDDAGGVRAAERRSS